MRLIREKISKKKEFYYELKYQRHCHGNCTCANAPGYITMKAPVVVLGISFLMVTIGTIEAYGIARNNVSPDDLVYSMCQESRTTNNVAESTCGDLQDHFHMEYMCESNNAYVTNRCWVEDK